VGLAGGVLWHKAMLVAAMSTISTL
jgi:hypothetical protein